MGFFDKVLDLVAGKSPEVKEAEAKMGKDAQADARRKFVLGLLAVSYDVDPAYLKKHAKTAMRDWYGISSAAELDGYAFGSNSHEAYNVYRRAFLSRAAFGAGIVDEAGS